jgi:hypothetical protein
VTLPNTASFGARILRRPDFTGPPICLLLRRWADGFGRRLQSRSESLTRSAQRSESLVMKADDARRLLASANEEDPIVLTEAVLAKLQIDDVPDGASFQVGTHKDNAIHLAWNGTIHRHGNRLFGEADHTWTRKYWYSPLGLEQYFDLVRRAVEARHRTRGDVELSDFDDDGAYISLRFRIDTIETGLGAAYGAVRKLPMRSKRRRLRLPTKWAVKSRRSRPDCPGGAPRISTRSLMPSRARRRQTTRDDHWKNLQVGYSILFPASQ